MRASTLLSPINRPELDATPDLSLEDISYFQWMIGIIRGDVELGCIDITCEVSMMSYHIEMTI